MKLKAFLLFFLLSSFSLLQAADKPLIKIETERTSLIYQVVLHTVSQISFSPLWQILDIGIMVKLFAQVFLIQTSVVSYLIDKAGPFGFYFDQRLVGSLQKRKRTQ